MIARRESRKERRTAVSGSSGGNTDIMAYHRSWQLDFQGFQVSNHCFIILMHYFYDGLDVSQ